MLGSHPSARGAPRPTQIAPLLTAGEVDEGLQRGEFEAFFQPTVEIKSGQAEGAEALARWRHPTKGLIYPDLFIPVVESSGLMDELTRKMTRDAASNCHAWREAGFDMTVSVNLSPGLLSDLSLADRMTALVKDSGLEARHVTFEITESTAASELGKELENLARLRMKGFGLSIDDFGTGHSSMERLTRIPFTELKIDQSFVKGASRHPSRRAVVESSLELARKLGIAAVAEGVDKRAEWDLLLGLGCTLAQGYFLAQPMEATAFGEWLAVRRQDTA